jgi:hypothetical protein
MMEYGGGERGFFKNYLRFGKSKAHIIVVQLILPYAL